MRDQRDMDRIKISMEHGGVIEIRRTTAGRTYWLDGTQLRGQIVHDMISDGWLIEGDSSLRLAA
jgi:hypothetical protein